jgi:hypothetical protein
VIGSFPATNDPVFLAEVMMNLSLKKAVPMSACFVFTSTGLTDILGFTVLSFGVFCALLIVKVSSALSERIMVFFIEKG